MSGLDIGFLDPVNKKTKLRYLPSCYFAELTLSGILSQSDWNVMAGPESAKKKELVTLLANLVRHLIEGVINGNNDVTTQKCFFCSAGWLTTWGEQERFWTLSMNEGRGKKVPFGNWSDPGQIQPDDWVRFLQKEKEKNTDK